MKKTKLEEKLKYGLYKYIYKGEIIYIGKSDKATIGSGIPQRIKDHSREQKFQPYLDKSEIFFMSMVDCVDEIDANETLLIKQYAPILNITNNPHQKSKHNYEAALLQTRKWEPFKLSYLNVDCTDIRTPKKSKRNYISEIESFLNMYEWIYKKVISKDYEEEFGKCLKIVADKNCPYVSHLPLIERVFTSFGAYHNWFLYYNLKCDENRYKYYRIYAYYNSHTVSFQIKEIIEGLQNSILALKRAYLYCKRKEKEKWSSSHIIKKDIDKLSDKDIDTMVRAYYQESSHFFQQTVA